MLVCKNINKTYQSGDVQTEALKNISFQINDGEFVAIIGPSGSGKSTLMHIIGALDTPTSGDYYFGEQRVNDLSEDELANIRNKKIGFVFQSFNLLPRATVIRNVTLPLVYAGIAKEQRIAKAKESLLAAGFDQQHWHHLSNQLSGGQMQRVAIARALVNDPTLILADEPTGNLDTKTGEIVLETFRRLNKERGCTVILITHEFDVAKQADRIIHIRDGQLLEDKKN